MPQIFSETRVLKGQVRGIVQLLSPHKRRSVIVPLFSVLRAHAIFGCGNSTCQAEFGRTFLAQQIALKENTCKLLTMFWPHCFSRCRTLYKISYNFSGSRCSLLVKTMFRAISHKGKYSNNSFTLTHLSYVISLV